MQNVSKNLLLQSLPENVSELLGRHLRKALLPSQSVIYEPGDIPAEVYFPETAAISLVVVFSNGTFAEAAMVGRDGMLGGFSTLHDQRVAYRAVVQIKGEALVINLDVLRRIARQHEAVMRMLLGHEHAMLTQAQQIAACNASHSLESRLCRWLLRASDACGKRVLATTQESIAEMLGVKRTSVSLMAHALQEAGLVKNRRGHLELLNLSSLQERACECYSATAKHYDYLTRTRGAKLESTKLETAVAPLGDVPSWGVLTAGTGLGNACFTNRKLDDKR